MEPNQAPKKDAASEFIDHFYKQLLPYLIQSVPGDLLQPGREKEACEAIVLIVMERLKADRVPIGRKLTIRLMVDILKKMPLFAEASEESLQERILPLIGLPSTTTPLAPPVLDPSVPKKLPRSD